VNIAAFIVSFGLFAGGLWVMAAAFTATGYELALFFLGILCSTAGVMIPIHVLKRIDG